MRSKPDANADVDDASGSSVHIPASKPHHPNELEPVAAPGVLKGKQPIEFLRDVRMRISINLGTSTMSIRKVLSLKEGDVVKLDRLAGELADVCVNGILLAQGEIICINDMFAIRLNFVDRNKELGAEREGDAEVEQ